MNDIKFEAQNDHIVDQVWELAWRQSSVTGGAEKYLGGHRQILPSSSGVKTKKKGLHCSRLSSFGAQVSRGDTAESNGADLASCPQIQG